MNVQQARELYATDPGTVRQAEEKLQALLERSSRDMEFRGRLLSDPRAAVSEFTGAPAPADFNVVFVENRADATIVLPDPVVPSAELSDAELETVAGGVVITAGAIAVALFCAFVAGATSD